MFTYVMTLGVPGRSMSRTVYNIMDFLGDIGGFYGTFSIFFGLLINIYDT